MANGATGLTLTIAPQLVEKEVKYVQERVQCHDLAVMHARERLQMFSHVELLNAQLRFILFFSIC